MGPDTDPTIADHERLTETTSSPSDAIAPHVSSEEERDLTASDDPRRSDRRRLQHERRRRRRVGLVVLGVVVALVGAGIGIWLATRGSGSSTSTSANTYLADGVRAQLAGQLALADADYLHVIRLDPHNKIAWYDLGVIQQQSGNKQQAETDYDKAIAADSRYVPALYNLGTLVAPADPASAARIYEKVISIQPGMAAAHLNLGYALKAMGQYASGQAQIAEALRLDPSLSPSGSSSTTTPPNPAPSS